LVINHQGVVKVNGALFTGTGLFRFAILNPNSGLNGWTNDGSALFVQDGTPSSSLSLPVNGGLYSVRLGDPEQGMPTFPDFLFNEPDRVLRVWFDDGTNGLRRLTPDHPFTTSPYSFRSLMADRAEMADAAVLSVSADYAADADTLDGLDSTDLIAQISDSLQRIVREFEVAPDESVETGDVVSFVAETPGIGRGFQVPGVGPEFIFGATTQFIAGVGSLSESKFVVVFNRAAGPSAIVGEVVGASLEFGAPVVFNATRPGFISFAALSPGKFAAVYKNGNLTGLGTIRIGEVTGREIQFGPPQLFNATDTFWIAPTALSPSRFAFAYTDARSLSIGNLRVADVAGATVNLSSETNFEASSYDYLHLTGLSSTRFLFARGPEFALITSTVRVANVSGTSLVLGPTAEFNAEGEARAVSMAVLSPSRFVVAYGNLGSTDAFGAVRVGDLSGDTITIGDKFEFADHFPDFLKVSALSSSKFLLTFNQFVPPIPLFPSKWVVGRIEENDVVFGPERFIETRRGDTSSSLVLPNNRFLAVYIDGEDSFRPKAVLGRIDATAVIGIARESGMEGDLVDTTLFANGSVSDSHTGLVPGTTYYGQPDGSISTDDTGVKLGVAVSSNEILLDP
jgi:hypothetical protein